MKNFLFKKSTLIVVAVTAFGLLLLSGSLWADLMNPDRRALVELQSKRAQNEVLIQQLKEEHAKVTEVRDQVNTKLGELNGQLFALEEKGKLAREANADLTAKIESGGKG
jgi:septal ring factor EnvC (AmiA/AmiB activator)